MSRPPQQVPKNAMTRRPLGSEQHQSAPSSPLLRSRQFLLLSLFLIALLLTITITVLFFFFFRSVLPFLILFLRLSSSRSPVSLLHPTIMTLTSRPRPALHRRLLALATDRVADGQCSASDITIVQGEGEPLPDGIPTFSVQIFNGCMAPSPAPVAVSRSRSRSRSRTSSPGENEEFGGCCGSMANIHVACGWWATAKLVNPAIFRRLGFDDCLVNDGRPLKPGHLLTFEYANSFAYPMTVTSVSVSPCS